MNGPGEVRTGRGSAGLVRGGDERRQANETSGKGKGKGNGGKGKHESMGSLGSKGTQEAQQNTRKMKVTDEDEEEEMEHEEECDCWDYTRCWEYIDDEGVQRGPFCNWQMRDCWQKRMLPKSLDIRPCDARASANRKRGDSQVPEEEDAVEGEKNGMRRLRWADCDDNEEDEEERQEVER